MLICLRWFAMTWLLEKASSERKKQGFAEEQRRMLEKWKVPKKYYEIIEDMSYTKEEGYFIYLKEGFIMT